MAVFRTIAHFRLPRSPLTEPSPSLWGQRAKRLMRPNETKANRVLNENLPPKAPQKVKCSALCLFGVVVRNKEKSIIIIVPTTTMTTTMDDAHAVIAGGTRSTGMIFVSSRIRNKQPSDRMGKTTTTENGTWSLVYLYAHTVRNGNQNKSRKMNKFGSLFATSPPQI